MPLGDVHDHGQLDAATAVVVTQTRNGQVRPHHRTARTGEPLLQPDAFRACTTLVPIGRPYLPGILGVSELVDPPAVYLRRTDPEQLQQCPVGLNHRPVSVADRDPDRGAGKDQPEPGIARVQRRLVDRILSSENLFPESLRVPVRQTCLESHQPGPVPVCRIEPQVVEQPVPDGPDAAGQRIARAKAVLNDGGADDDRGRCHERFGEQSVDKPVGQYP